MKFLSQKPLFFEGRVKPLGLNIEWQHSFRTAGSKSLHLFERIKSLGFTATMDDYEKRKLGIFNQLNFFQLLTGVVIPLAAMLGVVAILIRLAHAGPHQ